MIYINKKLRIENINLENIAQKYGTPAYCYSYNQLKDNISRFKRNFASFSPIICFAVKSNTNLSLLKEIRKFGLGADVVSQGELMMAIKAGIDPKKIVFSGVGKSASEITYAINKKILLLFKKYRYTNTPTHVEIEVAIGIIRKPILLKNPTLMIKFKKTINEEM